MNQVIPAKSKQSLADFVRRNQPITGIPTYRILAYTKEFRGLRCGEHVAHCIEPHAILGHEKRAPFITDGLAARALAWRAQVSVSGSRITQYARYAANAA
ncbi:hypothetical protein ABFW12_23285 [Mycolicibacterium porcinum]|uniref:Uncharacterized protein n=1 Tax=Mycolicibacterium porcinum TaxID=39693 RepID=A0ABV3VID3_9MYCO